VLEAIYLVSTLRSFRTSDLGSLLRRGCEHARVEVQVHDPVVELRTRLEVRIDRQARSVRRSARLEGKLVRSAADFYGRIQAVLFTPEDLGVLRGSPQGRRQFVDRVLFARERAHIGDVQAYEKLLRSRNKVLKVDEALLAMHPAERERLLDTYDRQLAQVGGRIWSRRAGLIAELQRPFQAAFAQIHDRGEQVLTGGLEYRSRIDPTGSIAEPERAVALAEALRRHRVRDLAAGRTTVGPHLDDLQVSLDGADAAEFASQGQARALVLAFKIAELRSARERGQHPLLLLDDVSSELDPVRTARLFEVLAAEIGQCVLTTTTPRYIDLGGIVGDDRREVEVRDGRLVA
jgi:DNA replication and repair protein RecF